MKKGSKRHSGNERLRNHFEDITASPKFLSFAKQMNQEWDQLSAYQFTDITNPEELNKYWDSFIPWENKVKDFCSQNGFDPSEFYPTISIIIRHGKGKWITVTSQEMVKIKERISKGSDSTISLEISPYASRNNILEFIERNYISKIQPVQNKHKHNTRLDKVRSKRTKVRDDYICQIAFEGKNPREIVKLTDQKFPDAPPVGYNEARKILKKKNSS